VLEAGSTSSSLLVVVNKVTMCHGGTAVSQLQLCWYAYQCTCCCTSF
jgi:hypothetical protein